jgi:Uma2 family endonuclease
MIAATVSDRAESSRPVPAKRKATYQDVLDAPPERVAEILGDDLYLSPRPAPRHSAAAGALYYELAGPFRFGRLGPGGWMLLEEPELHLEGRGRPIVPDIAGWRRERMPVLPETPAIALAPDWVCEVLSPSTEAIDRNLKVPIYARAGVAHLWLVDPARRRAESYTRSGDDWRQAGAWSDEASVHIEPFAAVAIDLSLLWSR